MDAFKALRIYEACEGRQIGHGSDKEYSDYYHQKYNEVTKFQHKRALALTARKFVRLIFDMLHKNHLYIDKKEMIAS